MTKNDRQAALAELELKKSKLQEKISEVRQEHDEVRKTLDSLEQQYRLLGNECLMLAKFIDFTAFSNGLKSSKVSKHFEPIYNIFNDHKYRLEIRDSLLEVASDYVDQISFLCSKFIKLAESQAYHTASKTDISVLTIAIAYSIKHELIKFNTFGQTVRVFEEANILEALSDGSHYDCFGELSDMYYKRLKAYEDLKYIEQALIQFIFVLNT